MSDEELIQIAESGDELSGAAQGAFAAEVAKRGLRIEIAPPRDEWFAEFSETVTLRQFRDLPEALLAKGSLESAGIQAYLIDDNMIRMDWFISNLLGGIKLKVGAEDVAAASEILDQPIPEILDVEGAGGLSSRSVPGANRSTFHIWWTGGNGSVAHAITSGNRWAAHSEPVYLEIGSASSPLRVP
jgi:hypothetical protein